MANVLHRTRREYLESVNTPDYDTSEWIINPDLTSVLGLPVTAWKIMGDTVRPMTAQELSEQETMAPYASLDITAAKAIKCVQSNGVRDTKLDGGWTYGGVLYDSDAISRQNMAGTMTLISSGYTLPDDFVWRAADNTDHSFDNAGFVVFFQAFYAWIDAVFRTSWSHKDQINAKTTVADVAGYDCTVGYPAG